MIFSFRSLLLFVLFSVIASFATPHFVVAAPFNGAVSAIDSVPSEKSYTYLLSKPIPMDIKIGKAGKILHYIYWGSEIVFKTGVVYAASDGHLLPSVTFFSWTLGHSIPYITGHSLLDLSIRQAIKSNRLIKKLSVIPYIKRAFLINSGSLRFEGLFVRARAGLTYAVIETDEPLVGLSTEDLEDFGEPIELSRQTVLNLRLQVQGEINSSQWSIPLLDLLHGELVPSGVANAWREQIEYADVLSSHADPVIRKPLEQMNPNVRRSSGSFSDTLSVKWEHFLGLQDQEIQIDADIQLADGTSFTVVSMLSGSQIRKLLGMTHLQRSLDYLTNHKRERPFPLGQRKFDPKKMLIRNKELCASLLQK